MPIFGVVFRCCKCVNAAPKDEIPQPESPCSHLLPLKSAPKLYYVSPKKGIPQHNTIQTIQYQFLCPNKRDISTPMLWQFEGQSGFKPSTYGKFGEK